MKPHSLHLAFRPACLGRCYRAATRGWGEAVLEHRCVLGTGRGNMQKGQLPSQPARQQPTKACHGVVYWYHMLDPKSKVAGLLSSF